jgi:ubiquinone/menaquinone biosynthesis C-methylase UbiE
MLDDESKRPSLDEINYYDYMAMVGMPYFHWGGLKASNRLAELLDIGNDTRVLVVGCGTGYSACWIASNTGCELTGIDISEKMVERAQERSIEWGLEDRVDFQQDDAYHLKFDDGEFDAVMTEFVSVFLDKPSAFFECARVIRPRGKLGVNELYTTDEMPDTTREKITEVENGFSEAVGLPLRIPTLSDWKSYFTQAGLEDILQEEVQYKYSVKEMKAAVGGWAKLFRMTGRALWDMTRNSSFRDRGMAVGRLKDTLLRYRDTKDFTGAVLCVGTKPF